MKKRVVEISTGVIVIVITVMFVLYFFKTITSSSGSTYNIKTIFADIGNLKEGSNVKINGVKIGKVISISMDVQTYLINVSMSITNKIKIDKDSEIKIQSSSFFDAPDLVIIPSKGNNYLKDGDSLWNSKDWVSLEEKIGSMFVN